MLIMDPSADDLARMVGEGHAPVVAVLLASAEKEKGTRADGGPQRARILDPCCSPCK
jgi:hypothetical protein